jgi:hypothetical protein
MLLRLTYWKGTWFTRWMEFSGDDLSPVVSAVEALTLLKPHYGTAVHENRVQKAISGLETSKYFHLCFL